MPGAYGAYVRDLVFLHREPAQFQYALLTRDPRSDRPNDTAPATDLAAVSSRAQAYLCMQHAGLDDASILEKAKFLMTLGFSRADAAALLGSTDDSLRVNFARAAIRMAKKK